MRVEFFRHELGAAEEAAVREVFGTIFLTTAEKNSDFERLLAEYLGVQDTVTVSSCTAALHLALIALGIGPGDEVVTTPLSFVATANAVLLAGATPVFVDVDPATGLLDLDLVKDAITPATRAILPVHLYGGMVDMVSLRQIADAHGLVVIEDAAHALEASRDGIRPGNLGEAACFSFYPTKSITCGEGGALATNSEELAGRVRRLRNHGMTKGAADRHTARYEHWDIELLGWKYNLTNFQAAMLIPQLAHVEERRRRRAEICALYEERLRPHSVSFPDMDGEIDGHARHLFTVWAEARRRDDILLGLQDAGIGVGVHYRPIHLTTYYRKRFGHKPGSYPAAERIGASTFSLPLYPSLRAEEVEHVAEIVIRTLAS